MKPLETVFRSYAKTHPEGAARALEKLTPEQAANLLSDIPASVLGRVVERLIPQAAAPIVDRLGPEKTRNLIKRMSPRHAASLLQQMEPEQREKMLEGLSEKETLQIKTLLRYPAETAGGMMNPQVSAIPADFNVRSAIRFLRKAPRRTLYYLYVVDRERKLQGVVGMRKLLLARPSDKIEGVTHSKRGSSRRESRSDGDPD